MIDDRGGNAGCGGELQAARRPGCWKRPARFPRARLPASIFSIRFFERRAAAGDERGETEGTIGRWHGKLNK